MEGRILVAEDDDATREAAATALRLAGYTVDTACNGAEALAAVERAQPAAILLDLRMPVLDGTGFAHELERRRSRIPLVVMSASENGERLARAMDAAAFLAKPFAVHDLLQVFARLGLAPGGHKQAA